MSEQFTPTTDEVRGIYVTSDEHYDVNWRLDVSKVRAEFDRWLAKRDAEVAAKALEEAADLAEGVECIVLDPVMEKIGKNVGLSLAQEFRARATEYRKAVES